MVIDLLLLSVKSLLIALRAIFLSGEFVGMSFLVLSADVILALAFTAAKNDINSFFCHGFLTS
jgi:hypothetical protein